MEILLIPVYIAVLVLAGFVISFFVEQICYRLGIYEDTYKKVHAVIMIGFIWFALYSMFTFVMEKL